VGWRLEDGALTVETTLPQGVTGVLSLEGERDVELTEGTHRHRVEPA
jgi:hypothetical protein